MWLLKKLSGWKRGILGTWYVVLQWAGQLAELLIRVLFCCNAAWARGACSYLCSLPRGRGEAPQRDVEWLWKCPNELRESHSGSVALEYSDANGSQVASPSSAQYAHGWGQTPLWWHLTLPLLQPKRKKCNLGLLSWQNAGTEQDGRE